MRFLSKSFALAATVVLVMVSDARSGAQAEIAVIVNAENPVAQMSAADVRTHFMKQKSAWPNGEKIRPVDLESNDAGRQVFLSEVLKTTPQDLERHWLEIKYRAAESPPKRVDDSDGVVKYVSAFKGGIGFIEVSDLEKTKSRPVKVVLTIKGR